MSEPIATQLRIRADITNAHEDHDLMVKAADEIDRLGTACDVLIATVHDLKVGIAYWKAHAAGNLR